MDRLEIRLLGSFMVAKGGTPLTGFDSNKVRALLAYLSVEADRPHERRKLAALLWPDLPDATALSNLRYSLSNLRKIIGDRSAKSPFLGITPQKIWFIASNNSWVDVAAFDSYCIQAQQNPLDFDSLEKAADLSRGRFLEGFAIPDSNLFEEWVVLKREHFDHQVLQVLHRLAKDRELSGEYQQAILYAEQQLELDPWSEEAHRRLMRCLYFTGQRTSALAQYEACCMVLERELSVEPELETRELYIEILNNTLSPPGIAPTFLRHAVFPHSDLPRFAARQGPLKSLHLSLDRALAGQGQLMLVTGSPGQGKTALVKEFIRQALKDHPTLAAAWGNSHAYFGSGDPYLPFREILEMLTGQVEHRWEAGSISQEHALRLWRLAAFSTRAIVQEGPALLGSFISGQALMSRASLVIQDEPAWMSNLRTLVGQPTAAPVPRQQDFYQQYGRVLSAIARQVPLLLFLDDLQWADQSSLALLFHLTRVVRGSHIMIIGAFRPVEALSTSGTQPLSLATMVNELALLYGDILINLDELEQRDFIDAYLDLEPNQLDEAFRQELFRYTHGHPLFTIEMLYGMQERGDLHKNPRGEWVTSPALNWDNLPARVEAVIAERLRQLPHPLRKLLQVASVEGEYFTGEVVAKVQGMAEQQVLRNLSTELDRRFRLVLADSTRRVNGTRISRYRFRHILYQRYLYRRQNLVERARLHERVGNTLEAYHAGNINELAVQLAVHFELAGNQLKAIHYLNIASRQAAKVSSFEDAIDKISKARTLLAGQPESAEKDQLELELLMSLIVPLEFARSFATPELGTACDRMTELMRKLPLDNGMFPAIVALGSYYIVRADYQKARATIPLQVELAKISKNELFKHFKDFSIGYVALWLGRIKVAPPLFDQMIEFYDPVKYGEVHLWIGSDPCVDSLLWSSWALWLLGYPEKALARSQQAVELGHKLNHPGCLAMAQDLCIYVHLLAHITVGIPELIQALSKVLAKHPFPLFASNLEFLKGYHQALNGNIEEGIEGMKKGIEAYQSIGMKNMLSMHYTLLAQVYLQANQLSQAAHLVQQAEDFIESTGERYYQAETLRIKGELLLHQYPQAQEAAADCFSLALQVAHAQEAKTLELRAAMSLARLQQGRIAQVRQHLQEVYNWFTEGFDTPDLKEAQALLASLR